MNITALRGLKTIFYLSKFQSKEMDRIMIQRIYNDHILNKKSNNEYKNVIVNGGNTVGLYAAFLLFIEGMNVTLITHSSEEYTDNQYIFVDRKWMSQLRYILGTGFDQLYVEDKSLSMDVNNDIGFIIKSKSLEALLKERLNKLIEHVNKQKGNHEENVFLEILDETEIIEIDLKQEKPLAILRKYGNRSFENIKEESENVNKRLKIDGNNFHTNKNEMKHLEGESEADRGIQFDVFFCADNDNISNKFLGNF
uniref:Uncharacterized protein n=1 Tax=Meloidogyne enterolobii TaxID=390850 RepID=A0A6V7WVZ0_MELEN|nr:unnamed protein product [Meloidogyne enterolobii]